MRSSTGEESRGDERRWQRSSFCGGSGCVEVAIARDVVQLRDAKHPAGAALAFDRSEWTAFVGGVKAGEFDLD